MKFEFRKKVNTVRNQAFKTKQSLPKDKFKIAVKLIGLFLAFIIVVYLIGLITQFFIGAATQSLDLENINKNFFSCIKFAFYFKYSKLFWFIAIVLILIIFLKLLMFKDDKEFSNTGEYDNRDFYYSEKGDFGTNKKMTIVEMENVFDVTKENNIPNLEHLKTEPYLSTLKAYENLISPNTKIKLPHMSLKNQS